jgi:signal peptidase I
MIEPNPNPLAPPSLRQRLADLTARLRGRLAAHPPDWRRTRQSAFEIVKTLLIAFLLAQLIMVSVAQAFQVEQFSMEPTLLPHDRVLVSKFIYRLRTPARGDVIVLRYPRNPERNYIKRVIGLPGERIAIKGGTLYVNGRPVKERYLNGGVVGDYGPLTVPADTVFVLGDNRNNSEDSRAFGPLKDDLIVGQAILIYWPPQRVRLLAGR